MKILFIGCVEGSYRLLKKLLEENKDVVGVVTKEKSDFNADFYDLTPLCQQYEIPYHYVKNINEDESVAFMRDMNADIAFCFGWSQLIKEEVINLFNKGVVGFHPAALPKNRGRHPLIWALILGFEKTASSFFIITPEADEGDIVSQKEVLISYEDDARTLYDKVLDVAVEQEIEMVEHFEDGTIERISQDTTKGNTWRKRGKADGQIDWRMSSRSVYNLVRALTKPYVGAHFVYNDKEYKVWKVKELDITGFENIEPGKVLKANNDYIDVKTADGAVRLLDFDRIEVKEGDYLL